MDNSDTGTSVTVDKADYSRVRNSCVAEVETTTYFRGGYVTFDRVQDLLSGETLFTASESQTGSGSNAKRTGLDLDIIRFRFLPRVWDYVLNNADEPVALQKEYGRLESDLAPKAITSSPSAAEPNDWHSLPVTEYDAQGKPITSPESPGRRKQDYYPDTVKPTQSPTSKH